MQCKRGLVKILAYWVQHLCFEKFVDSDLTKVRNTLIENGYPV